ncbi:MAG: hypothetical protein ACI9DC_000312 [Gammaproteobacteria bacterium]
MTKQHQRPLTERRSSAKPNDASGNRAMQRLSFRARIVILLTVLVLMVQCASFFAVLSTINSNEKSDTQERLSLDARLLNCLVEARHSQLLQGVAVLAADFGFKAAVASRDSPTIASALAFMPIWRFWCR